VVRICRVGHSLPSSDTSSLRLTSSALAANPLIRGLFLWCLPLGLVDFAWQGKCIHEMRVLLRRSFVNVTILNLTSDTSASEPSPVATGNPFAAILGTFAEICSGQLSGSSENNDTLATFSVPSSSNALETPLQPLPPKPAIPKTSGKNSSLLDGVVPTPQTPNQPVPNVPTALPLDPTQTPDVALPASEPNPEPPQQVSSNSATHTTGITTASSTLLTTSFPLGNQDIHVIPPHAVPPAYLQGETSAPRVPTLNPSRSIPESSTQSESPQSGLQFDPPVTLPIASEFSSVATPNLIMSSQSRAGGKDLGIYTAPQPAPAPDSASTAQSAVLNNKASMVSSDSSTAPDPALLVSSSSPAATPSDLPVSVPENNASAAQGTSVTGDEQAPTTDTETNPSEELVSSHATSEDPAGSKPFSFQRSSAISPPRSTKLPSLAPLGLPEIPIAPAKLNQHVSDEALPFTLPSNSHPQPSHPTNQNQTPDRIPVSYFADQIPSLSQTATEKAARTTPPAAPQAATSQNVSPSNSKQNDSANTNTSNPPQPKQSAPPSPAADPVQPPAPPVPVLAIADPAVKSAGQSQTVPTPKPTANDPAAQAESSSTPKTIELPTSSLGPVQQAQMINKAAQSEMRIGLNTSAFGSVEVRTVVRASDVGLVIGSEKGDLRSLLSNDIPGIVNNLQQQNLRLTQVSFQQQGFAFSSDSSSGGNAQPRSFAPRPNPTPTSTSEPARSETTQASETRTSGHAGLSILA
jgi:Flagellar hook-length control protein FliK